MGFALKKLVSVLLTPLPFALLLLALAALRRRHRHAWAIAGAGLALLYLAALPAVAWRLAAALEDGLAPHVPVPSAHAPRAIVVLSGGYEADPALAPWDEMNVATLRRTLEGIRLAQRYPRAELWMSGGDASGVSPPAPAMAALAERLGIARTRLKVEAASRDTHDQAVLLAPHLGTRPFLLVTSAYHMRRSLALFRAAGTRPIAAPTDFLSRPAPRAGLRNLLPAARALDTTEAVQHEYLGLLWSRLRGQL